MSPRETATHAYVGRNKCGCVGTLCVDDPEDAKATARYVAMAVKDGQTLERVALTEIRSKSITLAACKDNPACVRYPRPPATRQKAAPQGALL